MQHGCNTTNQGRSHPAQAYLISTSSVGQVGEVISHRAISGTYHAAALVGQWETLFLFHQTSQVTEPRVTACREDLAACPSPSLPFGMAQSHQPWLTTAMGEWYEAGKGNLSLGFVPEACHQGKRSQSGSSSLFHNRCLRKGVVVRNRKPY